MKKLLPLPLLLLSLLLFFAFPMNASAYRGWAVGDWHLWQYYSQNGQETTFTATLHLERMEGRFFGKIYYDVLGQWEPIEDVEVTDNTLGFTRPMHGPQRYYGHFHGDELTGHYQDKTLHGEWRWRAVKD